MRIIKKLADKIKDELEDAKEYAEDYVEHKVAGDISAANRYREMANDELKHAGYLHEMAVAQIKSIEKTFTPTVEMEEKWTLAHKKYVEEVASIRKILDM